MTGSSLAPRPPLARRPPLAPRRPLMTGYPRGALLIIGVEFWERFSFYGMLAILALFLTAPPAQGGFGWSSGAALALVGGYSGAMYALPALGGYFADHVLGRRRAVALGASFMLVGQVLTASPAYLPALLGYWHGAPLLATLRSLGVPLGYLMPDAGVEARIASHGASLDALHGTVWLTHAYAATAFGFYAALFFLILGNALMKSTLVVLCGETFPADDPRRDGAFAYYYLGISLGAMLSGFAVGIMSERFGWASGFATAAFGMAIALGSYMVLAPRWLQGIGERSTDAAARDTPPAPRAALHQSAGRIGLLLLLAALMCTFSIGWFQMFGSWSLFIASFVNRSLGSFTLPVAWFSSINAGVVIVVAPLIASLWVRLAARQRKIDIVQKYCFSLIMAMLANGLLYAAAISAEGGTRPSVVVPLVGVTLLGIGEIVAWTATYGVVTRAAPASYASVTMGAWYLLTLGLGGYLSGVTGQWVDTVGYAGTLARISLGMALGAFVALLLRQSLKRLAERAGVAL